MKPARGLARFGMFAGRALSTGAEVKALPRSGERHVQAAEFFVERFAIAAGRGGGDGAVVRNQTFLNADEKGCAPFASLGEMHGAQAYRLLVAWPDLLADCRGIQPLYEGHLNPLGDLAQA